MRKAEKKIELSPVTVTIRWELADETKQKPTLRRVLA
jgi:hypothetical protein